MVPGGSPLVSQTNWRDVMGKYLIGWVMGLPGIVLVILYFFFR